MDAATVSACAAEMTSLEGLVPAREKCASLNRLAAHLCRPTRGVSDRLYQKIFQRCHELLSNFPCLPRCAPPLAQRLACLIEKLPCEEMQRRIDVVLLGVPRVQARSSIRDEQRRELRLQAHQRWLRSTIDTAADDEKTEELRQRIAQQQVCITELSAENQRLRRVHSAVLARHHYTQMPTAQLRQEVAGVADTVEAVQRRRDDMIVQIGELRQERGAFLELIGHVGQLRDLRDGHRRDLAAGQGALRAQIRRLTRDRGALREWARRLLAREQRLQRKLRLDQTLNVWGQGGFASLSVLFALLSRLSAVAGEPTIRRVLVGDILFEVTINDLGVVRVVGTLVSEACLWAGALSFGVLVADGTWRLTTPIESVDEDPDKPEQSAELAALIRNHRN